MAYPLYPRQMTKSWMPYAAYIFMICHRIGLPPTSTIGFGRRVVSSLSREPIPPARMTAFMTPSPGEPPPLLHVRSGYSRREKPTGYPARVRPPWRQPAWLLALRRPSHQQELPAARSGWETGNRPSMVTPVEQLSARP